jgi:quercetin dioxygenase-like cupin family protein
MHVVRGRPQGRETELRTSTFTGVVYGDPVLANDEVVVNEVFFAPCAHTYWHSHGAGQLLFVHHGHGVVVTRAGEVAEVRGGDVVWVPPGEEHWHGGTETTMLAHTAISIGPTNWLDEVSDEEVAAAMREVGTKLS